MTTIANHENEFECVKAWTEMVVIPTYEVGDPEKYPVFLENRVYQGSSGSVYPLPVIETIRDEKIDKEWRAVYIENQYLKVMILPELGGRIQMAYDKIRQRHFVYYNEVIKPALVGLTGPWISGGIEFNWPQHHRPSTYSPVDFAIEERLDGSATIWVSEIERLGRTKGMAGFTMYPDKAYLEMKGKLYNRTPIAQTFLWWANPAVAVNEHYQSVFPQDVNAVFDHGKRDVSQFPIAKGTYYKVDYSAGVDISRYANIPVPTSFMAAKSNYDFVGGYEHDSRAGMLHVANHHLVPGKKQWTWGNGDFGRTWDRNLTDKNGPYVEIMCGAFTDNQPDFSWMYPYEEKTFEQYFIPYAEAGLVKNASKDALVNLELLDGKIHIIVYVTSVYENARVRVFTDVLANEKIYLDIKTDLSPFKAFACELDSEMRDVAVINITVTDAQDRVLVEWRPDQCRLHPLPDPAPAAQDPRHIKTNEELYFTGLHIEQYRHATYRAVDYYKEALSRDLGDSRCNNAMGLHYLRSAKLEQAESHFIVAKKRITRFNENPNSGEINFNLGLCYQLQNKYHQAYDAFYKAVWNSDWQDASFFHLAQIDLARGELTQALELIKKSLERNTKNYKSMHLCTVILRKLNKVDQALAMIEESLQKDPFNFSVLFERYLITQDLADREAFVQKIGKDEHKCIEFSLDYINAGLFTEASILLFCSNSDTTNRYPISLYLIGYCYKKLGDTDQAAIYFDLAEKALPDFCFPNRIEEVIVLEAVVQDNPKDASGWTYLGNFWYFKKFYSDAEFCWRQSQAAKENSPMVLRNLALLMFNQHGEKEAALSLLKTAFQYDQKSARLLMELDQLNKKLNTPYSARLNLLQDNYKLLEQRDDLYLAYITLFNMTGKYEKAFDLLLARHFHPWEGGEGKVAEQYLLALVELAKSSLVNNEADKAITYLTKALCYPECLNEGKLAGAYDNDIYYWMGCAYDLKGDHRAAEAAWLKAIKGKISLGSPDFYNDQKPDKMLYQGLALIKLGQINEATVLFNSLINYGQEHLNDDAKIDYFAVSLPDLLVWNDDRKIRNQVHCYYLMSLGYIGLGNATLAKTMIDMAYFHDIYHVGVYIHRNLIDKPLIDLMVSMEDAARAM